MKGKKIIISALVATMVGTPVAVLNSATSAKAEEVPAVDEKTLDVLGPEVKLENGFKRSAKKGDDIVLPEFSSTAGEGNCTVKVLDPLGKEIEDPETKKYTMKGVYTFVVTSFYKNGDAQSSVASTYELTVTVTGDTGSLEMPDNSYFVVPSEFLKDRELKVPVPTAFVNDHEVTNEWSKNTATDTKNAVSKVNIDGADQDVQLKAFLQKGSEEIELTFTASTGNTPEKQAYFSHTVATTGTYRLVYKLYYGSDLEKPVAVSNAKTIKVGNTINASELFISWASTPKKTAEVGVEYNLPEVNASFSKGSTTYVDAYTEIVVKHVGTGETMKVDSENFTFVPKYKGNYMITYRAHIPSLGISSNAEGLSYLISNVEDATRPTIYLTGEYRFDENTGKTTSAEANEEDRTVLCDPANDIDLEKDEILDIIGDESHRVRSYYKLDENGKVTVKIPAAYVMDNFSGYHKDHKITVTRNLYVRTNTTDSGKLTLVKAGTESDPVAFNEMAEFTFDKNTDYGAGNYLVRYVAVDESGLSTTADYNITIKEYNDTKVKGEPTLTFSYDDEIVQADSVITFDAPTATDEYDTNLLVETFYSFDPVTEDNWNTVGTKLSSFKDTNEDGQFEIDVEKALNKAEHDYIYIYAVAQNNYETKVTLNKNFIVKKVLILGSNSDKVAPDYDNTTYSTVADFNSALVDLNFGTESETIIGNNGYITDTTAPFDQDDIVKIPTVSFKDDDAFVKFDIKVSYENDGEIVEVNALETGFTSVVTDNGSGANAGERYTHSVSGASFRTAYAKTYTITVVATDSNNNVSFVSYAVRVNDTEPPVIIVPNKSKFSADVEVGSEFIIPAPEVYDDNSLVDNAKWTWTIKDPNGANYTYNSSVREYVPTILGTYVLTYNVEDNSGNPATSSEYSINVVATELPTIELDYPLETTERAWDNSKTTQDDFVVPFATAYDKYFGGIVVGAPTVKNSKGEEVAVRESAEGWAFTPDRQGEYTITYSAQGEYKNNTLSLSVKIGDGEAPTLVWADKEEDLATSVEIGDEWTFKFDMVNLSDNTDAIADTVNEILTGGITSTKLKDLEDYVVISMKDPSNKTVNYTIADNGLKYKFDSAGTYTFTITLKDEAGNTSKSTYSYKITVNEKEKEEKAISNSVGTVLIVLSVVILAGVVAYFVITTKKG